jgi:sugar fermentation stimulation protein A
MKLASPLSRGVLIQRYKRFLADVQLDTGERVTATCPNTGSMLGLTAPGTIVWLSRSDNPKRKYAHTWEMVDLVDGGMPARVGINTGNPNRIVEEAIAAGRVPELAGYPTIRREVKYGANSRIDLLLEGPERRHCYVEIKNVHLSRRQHVAEFPDCKTERGAKHLLELSEMRKKGFRAVMFYLVQRDDSRHMTLAEDLDAAYASGFRAARKAGVEALAYCCTLTETEILVDRPLPFLLEKP